MDSAPSSTRLREVQLSEHLDRECFCDTNGTPRTAIASRHGKALVAVQVYVQHGNVEDLRIDKGESLIDRRGSSHGLAS